MDWEKWTSLLIKHFGLVDETHSGIVCNSDWREISSKRVVIEKHPWRGFTQIVGEGIHKSIVNALKKYADDVALERYMKEEGWRYEPKKDIYSIHAHRFIIFECDSIMDITKSVERTYRTRSDMFEIERIDDHHFIAYD